MEDRGLAEVLSRLDSPLGHVAEAGNGFRIGSPDFGFALTEKSESHWTHVSHDHSLKVESQARVIGQTVITSHTLENTGSLSSAPIDVIEPLNILRRGL